MIRIFYLSHKAEGGQERPTKRVKTCVPVVGISPKTLQKIFREKIMADAFLKCSRQNMDMSIVSSFLAKNGEKEKEKQRVFFCPINIYVLGTTYAWHGSMLYVSEPARERRRQG